MIALARMVALVLALVAATLAAVLAVREIVLAGSEALRWPAPHWWRWLIDTQVKGRATVAGLIAVLLAVAFLALAALALRRPIGRPGLILLTQAGEVGGDLGGNTSAPEAAPTPAAAARAPAAAAPEAQAVASVAPADGAQAVLVPAPADTISIKTSALEHLVDGSLQRHLADLRSVSSVVRRQPDGFAVSAAADVAAVDLIGLQQRAAARAAEDLLRATGIGLARLDLEVRRFIFEAGDAP